MRAWWIYMSRTGDGYRWMGSIFMMSLTTVQFSKYSVCIFCIFHVQAKVIQSRVLMFHRAWGGSPRRGTRLAGSCWSYRLCIGVDMRHSTYANTQPYWSSLSPPPQYHRSNTWMSGVFGEVWTFPQFSLPCFYFSSGPALPTHSSSPDPWCTLK